MSANIKHERTLQQAVLSLLHDYMSCLVDPSVCVMTSSLLARSVSPGDFLPVIHGLGAYSTVDV